jgi:exodeoxyribonuclease V gamma subunit
VLHIHRASRADALADALAALLAQTPADPFAPEVVAVPTRGMERWLTQRMSAVLGARAGRADGICANVEFPSPHRLITDAVAAASGIDPAEDPWLPERVVWPLLEVVDQALREPWLAVLATYLGADTGPPDPVRQARRLSAVGHLASLFDRYALHRPTMIDAWRRGEDVDTTGAPLDPDCTWQAELWRRLRTRVAVPDLPERSADACERLRRSPELLDLPPRVSLFGLTRLPAGHLEVLRALAHGRDVHLFLLHPSPALWDTLSGSLPGAPVAPQPSLFDAHPSLPPPSVSRRADRTADAPANRLLASWGRDAREMQVVLSAGAAEQVDHEHPSPAPPDTLLGRIQADVQADRPPPGAPTPQHPDARAPLDPEDRSIEIHSCHGRARQVEVIRDAILHALADEPQLEPRDVIVMCPDIETFAPLIKATFGAGETTAWRDGDGHLPEDAAPAPAAPGAAIDLRVRLADRSLRQTNPVLGVVSQLLDLTEQRVTASQMLDLADRGPVRRRFRLDDDDLTRLQDWISRAGIRWGLDALHRAPYKLDAVQSGTWQAGLERVLLGVTMTEDGQRLFRDVLPLDDVDSRSIELAGRFAELVTRVGQAMDSLRARQSLAEWAQALADAADLLTDTPGRDRWQRAELQRVLDEIASEADGSTATQLAPAEMRAFLQRRLEGRPTRANFRTGHLTVCTLMPMRSVPHRIVCLLGLDDGAFPRKAPRDGDDLMLAEPHIGERDPRSEDRQLLLDALLAAQDRLIVTYTGNDERTNASRPAAVPVGELLDIVDATAVTDGGHASDRVVIRHPLQPFDRRNFTAGEVAGPQPWSFDPVALEGALALSAPRRPPEPFLAGPLPRRADQVVELAELVRFVEHPVKAFLRQRLGIGLSTADDEIQDALSVELDGLERWGVGQRLLEARRQGVDERTAALAEIARGTLPPGVLGLPVITELSPIVTGIVAEAALRAPGGADAEPVDVRVRLADGRLLHGTVSGVCGDVLLTATFSRVSAKQRLAAWARLLALTATWPERPFSAVTVGRGSGRDDVRSVCIPALAATTKERAVVAGRELAALMDLYDRGLREPLPLFAKTSAAYAEAVRAGQEPGAAAAEEWATVFGFDREDREAEHQLVFGGVLELAELMEAAPASDEVGDGWAEAEPSRLGRLALRLWSELLDREESWSR